MADDSVHWLEKFGLGKYARAFANNEIDIEVLSRPSEQDFERIGPQRIGRALGEKTAFKVAVAL